MDDSVRASIEHIKSLKDLNNQALTEVKNALHRLIKGEGNVVNLLYYTKEFQEQAKRTQEECEKGSLFMILMITPAADVVLGQKLYDIFSALTPDALQNPRLFESLSEIQLLIEKWIKPTPPLEFN